MIVFPRSGSSGVTRRRRTRTSAPNWRALATTRRSSTRASLSLCGCGRRSPRKPQARAPKFNAWFEDFVNRSPYGPTLRKMRQGMTAWFEQSALDRARSKVGLT